MVNRISGAVPTYLDKEIEIQKLEDFLRELAQKVDAQANQLKATAEEKRQLKKRIEQVESQLSQESNTKTFLQELCTKMQEQLHILDASLESEKKLKEDLHRQLEYYKARVEQLQKEKIDLKEKLRVMGELKDLERSQSECELQNQSMNQKRKYTCYASGVTGLVTGGPIVGAGVLIGTYALSFFLPGMSILEEKNNQDKRLDISRKISQILALDRKKSAQAPEPPASTDCNKTHEETPRG